MEKNQKISKNLLKRLLTGVLAIGLTVGELPATVMGANYYPNESGSVSVDFYGQDGTTMDYKFTEAEDGAGADVVSPSAITFNTDEYDRATEELPIATTGSSLVLSLPGAAGTYTVVATGAGVGASATVNSNYDVPGTAKFTMNGVDEVEITQIGTKAELTGNVRYVVNGNYSGDKPDVVALTLPAGSSYKEATISDAVEGEFSLPYVETNGEKSNEGWQFIGWSTKLDDDTQFGDPNYRVYGDLDEDSYLYELISDFGFESEDLDVTLYAVFSTSQQYVTIAGLTEGDEVADIAPIGEDQSTLVWDSVVEEGYVELPDIHRTGYTLSGYKLSTSTSSSAQFVAGDFVYYDKKSAKSFYNKYTNKYDFRLDAIFVPNTYVLKYTENDNTQMTKPSETSFTYSDGTATVTLADPTMKAGYELDYWNLPNPATELFDTSAADPRVTVAGKITAKNASKFTQKEWAAELEAQYEKATGSVAVKENNKTTKAKTYTLDALKGFAAASTFKIKYVNVQYNGTALPGGLFDTADGFNWTENGQVVQKFEYSAAHDADPVFGKLIPSANVKSAYGAVTGWRTSVNGAALTKLSLKELYNLVPNGSDTVTLYPYISAEDSKDTVSLVLNAGEGKIDVSGYNQPGVIVTSTDNSVTLTITKPDGEGTAVSLAGLVATKDGETFHGWYDSAVTTATDYANNESQGKVKADEGAKNHKYVDAITVKGNDTLHAIWIPNQLVFNYEASGATLDPTTMTYSAPSAMASETEEYVKKGYSLYGWAFDATKASNKKVYKNEKEVKDTFKNEIDKTSDSTLKASADTIVIPKGTAPTADQLLAIKAKVGDKTGTPAYFKDAETANGWTYDSWTTTAYPVWIRNEFTITYHLNGAPEAYDENIKDLDKRYQKANSDGDYSVTYSMGEEYSIYSVEPVLDDAVIPGFDFEGWYLTSDSGTYIDRDQEIDTNDLGTEESEYKAMNYNVYARWTTNRYFLRFRNPKKAHSAVAGEYFSVDGLEAKTNEEKAKLQKYTDDAADLMEVNYASMTAPGTFKFTADVFEGDYNGENFKGYTVPGIDGLIPLNKSQKINTVTFKNDASVAWRTAVDMTVNGSDPADYQTIYIIDVGVQTEDAYYGLSYNNVNKDTIQYLPKYYNTQGGIYNKYDDVKGYELKGASKVLPYADPNGTKLEKAMVKENQDFMGWFYQNDKGYYEKLAENVADAETSAGYITAGNKYSSVPTNTGLGNVALYAVYTERTYYVSYAYGAEPATEAATIDVSDTVPGNQGFTAPENQTFRGWTIPGSTDLFAEGTKWTKLTPNMTPATYNLPELAKDGVTPIPGNYTSLEYQINEASPVNTLTAVMSLPYQVIYQYDNNGTIVSNDPVSVLENDTLPEEMWSIDGKKIAYWQLVNPTTNTASGKRDVGDTFWKWQHDFQAKDNILTATYRAVYQDAYTLNFTVGGQTLFSTSYAESALTGDVYLLDTIAGAVKKNAYADDEDVDATKIKTELQDGKEHLDKKDPAEVAGENTANKYFYPTEEGKHWNYKVTYTGTGTTGKYIDAVNLSSLKSLMTKTKSLDIELMMATNKYYVVMSYRDKNGALKSDFTTKAAAKKYEYGTEYDAIASANSKLTQWKAGKFKNWKIYTYEPTDDKDLDGNTVVPDNGDPAANATFKKVYAGTLAADTKFKDLTAVNGNVVELEANYDTIEFNVTFDRNDSGFAKTAGSASTSISGTTKTFTAAYGEGYWNKAIGDLTSLALSADGFYVVGWAKTAGATKADYTNAATVGQIISNGNYAASTTVYAVWAAKKYEVNYHTVGGNAMASTTYDLTKATPIQPATISDGNHYKFAGWYYDAAYKKALPLNSSTNRYYIPAGTTGDVDVYAKWAPGKVTVTFNPNNGDAAAQKHTEEYTYGVDTKLWKNTFTKKDAAFAGWSTSASGTTAYADQATARFTANTNLYAIWATKGTSKFTLTLDMGGIAVAEAPKDFTASGTNYTMQYTFGNKVTLPTGLKATDTNYTFKGWKDANGKTVKALAATQAGDVTYTAVWAAKTFKVKYNANIPKGSKSTGEKKMAATKVTYGESWAPASCEFEAAGYEFIGWSETATGDVKYDVNNKFLLEPWKETADKTLYAQWKAGDATVQLVTGLTGATITMDGISAGAYGWSEDYGNSYAFTYQYTEGNNITLPAAGNFSVDGATFQGWKKAKLDSAGVPTGKSTGKTVTSIKVGDTNTYIATWSGNYTITYHNGLDTVTQNSKLGKKTKALKLPKAWKDKEARFLGWAATDGGNIKFREKQKFTMNQGDFNILSDGVMNLDLYAVFEDKDARYTVNFYDFDGNIYQTSTFKFSKGMGKKKLTKIGKEVASMAGTTYGGWATFDDPADWAAGRVDRASAKYTKIAKKKVGNLDLYPLAKRSQKMTIKLIVNAPDGVKAKGKNVTKKNVKFKGTYRNYVKTNWTAKGWTLIGYSLTKGGAVYMPAVNNKAIEMDVLMNVSMEGSVTLYGVWSNNAISKVTGDQTEARANDLVYVSPYNYYYDVNTTDAVTFDDNTMTYDMTNKKAVASSSEVVAPNVYPNQSTTMYYQNFYAYDNINDSFTFDGQLPIPSRLGYTFAGWEELDGTGKWVAATKAITDATTRYFRATWKQIS